MFGWGKKRPSNPVANQALEKPTDYLAELTKQQIIAKLLELPWIETSTGIPGISINGRIPEELEFIERCTKQGLLYVKNSHSLGGDSRYVCVPEIVAAISQKPGFVTSDSNSYSRIVQSFIIENMGDIAKVMHLKGDKIKEQGSTRVRYVEVRNDEMSELILTFASHPPALFSYALSHTDLTNEKDVYSGHRYDLSEGRVGQGIAGQIYLDDKERQKAQGAILS